MKLLFIIALILFSISHGARAENVITPCITNHNAPPASVYRWPMNTEVRVYFVRHMFTANQRQTLFQAMATWNDTAKETGAAVRFVYLGETGGLASCQACLTVTRREVYKKDRKHYAYFSPLKQNEAGLLISAWIDFDFATTNLKALEGFMAHELGHGMGLWDCKNCKKKQTIMNSFPGINKDNGLVAPSACDLEVVRQAYQLERQTERNAGRERSEGGSQF